MAISLVTMNDRLRRPVADGQRHGRGIAVVGRTDRRLLQLPFGIFQLRLDLCHRRVDAADLRIHGELGALLRGLGCLKLELHRFLAGLDANGRFESLRFRPALFSLRATIRCPLYGLGANSQNHRF